MTRTPIDRTLHPRPTSLADCPSQAELMADADRLCPPPAPRPADPDKPCYHPDFDAVVDVARIGEDDPENLMPGMPTAFVAEISVYCQTCGEAFKFDGVPAGMSYDAPATSVDGLELRAPIRPVSLPPRRMRVAPGSISGYRIEGFTPGGAP